MSGQKVKFSRPDLAPKSVKAADGKTTLYRFKVDAVIYAPDRLTARERLSHAGIYLDAARIQPDTVTSAKSEETRS